MIRTRELGGGFVEVHFEDEALGMEGDAIVPAEIVSDLAVDYDQRPGRERLSLVDVMSGMTYARVVRSFGPAPVELEPVRHAYPAEPVVSEVITPDSFPGLGVDPAEPIDWYALNAYAELVGWRCRFLPMSPPFFGARILHPGDERFEVAASLSYAVDPRPRNGRGELV